jgi:SAM-dependent methyltransferase
MMDGYRDDLAYIHDAGFGGLARAAGGVLLDDLRRRGVGTGLVIDLGCGSGILAEQLAGAGIDVLGIDLSEALIAIARRRVPAGRFRVESLLTAKLEPCVAVAAVGECCNYLFDPGHTVEGLWQLFGRVFEALAPGGLFLFDIAGPGRGSGRVWAEGDDWAVLVHKEEDAEQRMLTRHITSFRRVDELYRRDHEVHRLRLLGPGEVGRRLEEIGFQVEVLSAYGPLPFAAGHAGFLARKPVTAP